MFNIAESFLLVKMGSLGEEDLEKLVFDYMESPVIIVSDHIKMSSRSLVSLQEMLGTKGEVEKQIEEKIKSFVSYEGDDKSKKKIVSKLRSDGYAASICKTSWDFPFDRREGCRVFRCTSKYEYIDVMLTTGDDLKKLKRVIIDLDFKSQFELVKKTEAYKDITDMLPTVFVATEERLKRVVSLVCREMKKSMKEKGMSRPPWRTTRYMQAKWLSENCKRDTGVKRRSWSVFDVGEDLGEAVGITSGINGSKTACCLPIF